MSAHSTPLFPWMTRDEVFRIESKRLWLRWPRLRDSEALQAIASQRSVATMTATWPHPLADGEAARRVGQARELNASGEALILALTLKSAPDHLIGQIGCNALPSEHLGLGYMLDPNLKGNGFATEAVHAFVTALFTYTHVPRITASARVTNEASRRVLEKTGLTRTGSGMLDTPAHGPMQVDFLELSRAAWKRQLEPARHAMLARAASLAASTVGSAGADRPVLSA
jgi:RimJ/RimL family protein N-acetyltransferase